MRMGKESVSEVGRREEGVGGVLAGWLAGYEPRGAKERKGKERKGGRKGGRERGHTLRSFSGVQDCGHDR